MNRQPDSSPANAAENPPKPLSSTRKPAGVSWVSFADQRIREAEAAGLFDNLPGLGKPIPGIDEPPDENWWVKRKLRDEGLSVVPPVLEARREIERVRKDILSLTDEAEVRRRLESVNAFIHQAMKSPVRGPADGVMPLDVEHELKVWRDARSAQTDGNE